MLTGAYAELANQVRIWSRQLRELNMLAGRMELGKYNKAYARMLVLRSQSELHSFASMGGSESKPDKREVERLSGKAIAEMAQTLNFVEAAAQDKLALAKQGIFEPGAKRDATRVQNVIDKMDDQYDEIEKTWRMIRGDNEPAIKAMNFQPAIYLKDKRKFTFSITGDKGLFAGFKVLQLVGKGGHTTGVSEVKQTGGEDVKRKKFKENVGGFGIDTAGEFGKYEMLQGMGLVLPGGKDHVKVTYTHVDLSGWFLIRICLHENRNKLREALKNGVRYPDGVYKEFIFNAIFQQGLKPLIDSKVDVKEKYGVIYMIDGDIAHAQSKDENSVHPLQMTQFGTKAFNEKLLKVGELFAEKFPGEQVCLHFDPSYC